MNISRAFAMPSGDTFSVRPIADFVNRWTSDRKAIVDPFARNTVIGHVRNDLDPLTSAQWHMEAAEFCDTLAMAGYTFDCAIFDPPYSPRQISECYKGVGRAVGTRDTQNARLYKSVRDGLDRMLEPGAVALSFGWNSAGFGKSRGYEILEILLVAHGGAHNDTICVAERKTESLRSPICRVL